MIFILVKQSVAASAKNGHASAIADHITSTGHNIKWDNFDILTTGRSDILCKIKVGFYLNSSEILRSLRRDRRKKIIQTVEMKTTHKFNGRKGVEDEVLEFPLRIMQSNMGNERFFSPGS